MYPRPRSYCESPDEPSKKGPIRIGADPGGGAGVGMACASSKAWTSRMLSAMSLTFCLIASRSPGSIVKRSTSMSVKANGAGVGGSGATRGAGGTAGATRAGAAGGAGGAGAGHTWATAGETQTVTNAAAMRTRVVVMLSANRCCSRDGRRVRERRLELALAQLVAQHTDLEEQRDRIDAAAHLIQIRGGDGRRTMDDFEQRALELVEHGGHGHLIGVDCILSIEPARGQQVDGPLLFSGDVGASRGVHDVGQHPLGPLEVIRDREQQHPPARRVLLSDRSRRRRLRR